MLCTRWWGDGDAPVVCLCGCAGGSVVVCMCASTYCLCVRVCGRESMRARLCCVLPRSASIRHQCRIKNECNVPMSGNTKTHERERESETEHSSSAETQSPRRNTITTTTTPLTYLLHSSGIWGQRKGHRDGLLEEELRIPQTKKKSKKMKSRNAST